MAKKKAAPKPMVERITLAQDFDLTYTDPGDRAYVLGRLTENMGSNGIWGSSSSFSYSGNAVGRAREVKP
jgi:hypothetical protein